MVLNEAQIQQFRTEGYLAILAFWSVPEVQAIQLEMERLKTEGKLRNVATEGDGSTESQKLTNLQVVNMFRFSDLFRAMPFAPQVIEAVGQLIGDPFLLHLDQAFVKPGRSGMGTSWHQDNAYFKISDPLKGTALWTAVHQATVANGTMSIIPGSFKEAYEHSRDPYSDHHIRCYPPEERAVAVELPAGGALFFAYGTAHNTSANNTDNERAGVAMHFLRTDYAAKELTEPDRECRPYITGPEATGGLKEYGVNVAGSWEREVDQVLQGASSL